MKVLVCTVVHNPTDARIFRRQIEMLIQNNHLVTAIAPWHEDTPGAAEVQRIKVPRAVGRARFRSWRAARSRMRDLLSSNDLLIVHDPELLLVVPWSEVRRTKTVVVWDVHEDLAAAVGTKAYIPKPIRGLISKIVRLLEKWAEKKTILLLAETAYQNRFKLQHEVVLNLPYVEEFPSAPKKKQAIYVGSITYERGLREMLALAKELSVFGISVRLIGECPNEDAAAEIKNSTNVVWQGPMPNAAALQEVSQSLVGLSLLQDLPNYQHSMPTKILEYMANGALVVTTPLPLAVEIATDAGVVLNSFKKIDYTAVASELNRITTDAREFESRTTRAFETVKNDYNWYESGPEFVQYLESQVRK
jgi:glycosyltransferase involved in cell wall biosynthesis